MAVSWPITRRSVGGPASSHVSEPTQQGDSIVKCRIAPFATFRGSIAETCKLATTHVLPPHVCCSYASRFFKRGS